VSVLGTRAPRGLKEGRFLDGGGGGA